MQLLGDHRQLPESLHDPLRLLGLRRPLLAFVQDLHHGQEDQLLSSFHGGTGQRLAVQANRR